MMFLAPGGGGQERVTICHKGHTITIGAPAVAAHLANHGDTIGACNDAPESDPTPPSTTTTLPNEPTPGAPDEPVAVCQEDEPCWDCETMGNRICGPTTEPPPTHSHEPAPHSHDELVLRCTVIDGDL